MTLHQQRINHTIQFLSKHHDKGIILDLGEPSELSRVMRDRGYNVANTTTDLDIDFHRVTQYDTITAFEIFEHMFAPFNLLSAASGKLICSVPINVWFSQEYWNDTDKRDCHYHEFTVRQFNHLLDRTGWRILASEKVRLFEPVGIRPMLRRIWPSYYFVCATKDRAI